MKWNRRDMVCMSNSIRWFGWQLRRDRGFLVFYIVALFCLFPLLTFAIYSPEDDSFLYLELVILPILCIVAMACFMPSHLFAHLWNKRELDLYSSIPLKRAAMFSLRFFYRLVHLVCPPAHGDRAGMRRAALAAHGYEPHDGDASVHRQEHGARSLAVFSECVDRGPLP